MKIYNLIFAILIIYSIISLDDFPYQKSAWYHNEIKFSDWRRIEKFDYVTNAVPYNWYNKSHVKYLRQENISEISKRLNNGDTLLLGADYYALFPISRIFFPDEFIRHNYDSLMNGKIVRMKIFLKGKNLYWEEYGINRPG